MREPTSAHQPLVTALAPFRRPAVSSQTTTTLGSTSRPAAMTCFAFSVTDGAVVGVLQGADRRRDEALPVGSAGVLAENHTIGRRVAAVSLVR